MATNFKSFVGWCRRHPIITNLALMIVVGVVLVWLALVFLDIWTHHGDDTTVPPVNHLTYNEAAAKLQAHHLSIEISDSVYDTSVPPGTVMESWPKAGSVVKKDRQVYVVITAFSPKNVTITMPVTGVSVRQAVSYLNALGIRAIRQVSVPSEYPDLVEGAHADGRPLGVGSTLPVNSTVVLEVGTVPEPEPDYEYTDSVSAEQTIADELSGTSVYEE